MMSMKMTNLVLITGFYLAIFCCKNPEKVQSRDLKENQVSIDTSWKSDQKALADWLESQTQEVRDAFKRDFTFSKQQIDSLKSSIGDTIGETNRDTTKTY